MNTTTPTRLPELMSRDRQALDALVDSAMVAHVAFVDDEGLPGVLPTAVVRWHDEIVVH